MDGTAEMNHTLNNLKGKIVSIPKVDSTLTKSGQAADAKVTGDGLEARVRKVDIVDNLNSTDTDKPLSANQGKVIKTQLDKINMSQAGTVGYSNSSSGLNATNMQGAIDEVAKISKDALPKNGGGTVTGPVNVCTTDNGYGSLSKNHSATDDYGTQVVDVSKDGKTAKACISALLGTFTYVDPAGKIRDVHHEGSKPFGEYSGSGSVSPRVIETKGIGRLMLLYCSSRLALVTPKGALVVNLTDGATSWVDSAKVFFAEGKLNIETSNEAFNASNTTYYYQVI